MDPAGWVRIPFVLLIGEGAQPSLDVFASPHIVERLAQGVRDEDAALPSSHAPVELLHERVVQAYVQSHGHTLTHKIGDYEDVLAISCARASISPAPTARSRSATRRPSASGS